GESTSIGEWMTIRLPGEAPHRLLGTIIDPYSSVGPASQIERFRIEASIDGERFETVLEGVVPAARREHAFEFPEPVEARWVRLTPLSARNGSSRPALGEWKVIAQDPPSTQVNLLEPSLGGQTVWTNVRPFYFDRSLEADGNARSIVDRGRPPDLVWVVGFHHGRAAQVQRLGWTRNPNEDGERVTKVEVDVSLTSPVGPFEHVATWDLAAGDLVLDEPMWARYLRFTFPEPEGGNPPNLLLPDAVAAYERPQDDAYRSILGEWGQYTRAASYEWSDSDPAVVVVGESQDPGEDRATAAALRPGQRATGSVAVAEDVDWYRIDVPDGDNLVEIALRGSPTIDYEYALYDADGEAVVFDRTEEGDGVRLEAFVDGEAVYLELKEPKRSIIFSWDTSGSVRPYESITYNSLAGFARDLDPEREFTQLLAYDNPTPRWLLPYWSATPTRVQSAINQFDRNADSSNSYEAVSVATAALADREGTRAILLMTDAESGGAEAT
ncbi:MAG: discoidin domain-containing protein, partial [Halobacteriales archaeon]|nr:discoidin domain-containing protein [Halobacteriales archaeon]